jgi:translation initiation factor 3 subunit D
MVASFSLPTIADNPDGGWGPSTSNLPEKSKFKDIPYAPYSKSDKLGRFADWNEFSDGRQAAVGLPSSQAGRAGGAGGRRREGAQAFGSGTASAFAYFHVEDESSFSLVDNKATAPRRGSGFARGRAVSRGGSAYNQRGGTSQRGGRGNFTQSRGGNQRGGRRGWRDWEKARFDFFFIIIGLLMYFLYRILALVRHLWSSRHNGICSRKSSFIDWLNLGWRLTNLKICETT